MKGIMRTPITLMILLTAACSAENILDNYSDFVDPSSFKGPAPAIPAEPEVVFTYFPPIPTGSYVSGKVININPAQYKLCLWIRVPGWGWVPKYTYAQWETFIQANSNWATTFYSGGHDYDADFLIHFAIPMSYPTYANINTLAVDSLTYTILDRWDARYGAPPSVAVTNLTNAYVRIENMSGPTNLTLAGTATDARYLRGVFVSVNGSSYRAIRPDKNVLWHSSMVWNTNLTFQMGSNIFRCYSKDCGEMDSPVTEMVIELTPDTTPPEISFLTPDGASLSGPSATVTGMATDNVQVARVYVLVNGQMAATFIPNSSSWSTAVEIPNGACTVSAYCVDTAGNTSVTRSITVYGVSGGDGSGGGGSGGGGDDGGPGGFTR